MSAPETNIEKQTRRHKPSLVGIVIAAAAVVLILLVVFGWPGGASDEAYLAPVKAPARALA